MHDLPEEDEKYLREIASKASTPLDTIIAMFRDCGYSREKLAQRISDTCAERPEIVVYLNGLLVNGRFYDFSDPSNLELKNMLDRGEFDREVLGMSGKSADVLVVTRGDYYVDASTADSKRNVSKTIDNVKRLKIEGVDSSNSVRFKYVVGKGKVPMEGAMADKQDLTETLSLPQEIRLDTSEAVKFKLVYANRSTTVFANERMTIGDLIAHIRERTGKTVTLSRRGEVLDENELVQVLKSCMVDVVL